MQDFPRPRVGQAGADAPSQESDQPSPSTEEADAATSSSTTLRPEKKAGAVGNAMKALFESSDVSIRRGDETRVMSRAQQALADLQHKSTPPPAPTSSAPPADAFDSMHPGPRVDKGLWIVLALGLFAIAGWMVAYAW